MSLRRTGADDAPTGANSGRLVAGTSALLPTAVARYIDVWTHLRSGCVRPGSGAPKPGFRAEAARGRDAAPRNDMTRILHAKAMVPNDPRGDAAEHPLALDAAHRETRR